MLLRLAPELQNRSQSRPIQMPSDWIHIRSIHDASRERDQTDPYAVCSKIPNLDLEDYRRNLDEAPRTLLLFVDECPAAHGWMESWGDEETLYLWRVWVDPEFRNLGIGTALLHWGEAEARNLHAESVKPAQYLANATEHEADAVRLLESEGYKLNFVSPELCFEDFASLPKAPPPDGLVIRPIDPSEFEAVIRGLAEANILHPGSPAQNEPGGMQSDELERRIEIESPHFRRQLDLANLPLSRAAWSGDRLAGVVLAAKKGPVGELPQVAVLAEWRGRGLAKALIAETLSALGVGGCSTVRLFTSVGPDETLLPEGPFVMYLKLGFKPIARHLRYRKPMAGH